MKHPFFEELFDPQNDDAMKDGKPVNYYDFEFEAYTINSKIIRELLLDEIILANCKEAQLSTGLSVIRTQKEYSRRSIRGKRRQQWSLRRKNLLNFKCQFQ
jgi:hypothetical protein